MEEELLNGKTLLVVDDEVDLRDIIASEMEFMGATVHQAGNITAAKEMLKNHQIDLIVSDIRMPGGTGIDLLDYVKSFNSNNPPMILITGFADITLEDALNKGAESLLSKPFKLDDLIKTAARFTQPTENRFSDNDEKPVQDLDVELEEDLETSMKNRDFLIGRGGVAVVLGTQRKKIHINEVINLNLKFKDRPLNGVAICRWIKVHEGGLKAAVGLEFIKLTGTNLDFFLTYWKKHPDISYVPIP